MSEESTNLHDALHAARKLDYKNISEVVPKHHRLLQAASIIMEDITWQDTVDGGEFWAYVHTRLEDIAKARKEYDEQNET